MKNVKTEPRFKDKEKDLGSQIIRKCIAPHQDGFGSTRLAIRQYINEELDQEIIFTEPETWELQGILNEIHPAVDDNGPNTSTPKTEPSEPADDEDDNLEDELDGLTDDEEEPKYLIIESRTSGGKKKNVLNWCETEAEAIEVLQTVFKREDVGTMELLAEKTKIVKYTELMTPDEFELEE